MNMLDKFRKAQQADISQLRELEKTEQFPNPLEGKRQSFAAALKKEGQCTIIAEFKRASPSKGIINIAISPADVARFYAENGAAAISVLTEKEYFQGDLAYLEVMACSGLPLLRKDFLLDPIQVKATAATKASAFLIIVRMLTDEVFDHMLNAAHDLGLETVIEVFDMADLKRARAALQRTSFTPVVIQVNCRDLDTLTISNDPLYKLIKEKKEGEVWIAASGAFTPEDVQMRFVLGYDAVLIGTGLMQGENPGQALSRLTAPFFGKSSGLVEESSLAAEVGQAKRNAS